MDIDVSGIVVSSSEIIRFEREFGIVFTLYNALMEFHFLVVALEKLQKLKLWKKIFVSHFYKILNLKAGVIQWLSGRKFIALLTTPNSAFYEISKDEHQAFQISNNLMKKITVPDVLFKSEHYFSSLISYQGIITQVKHPKLGLYELDNKVHLYCIFNAFRSILTSFKEGVEIFASNVHFLKDFKGRLILVCCGISSVKSIECEDNLVENETAFSVVNYDHYSLSIFDIIWLENLILELNIKLCSSIIYNCNDFHWESEVLNNILEYFTHPWEETHYNRQTLGDEYCSHPHTCCAFAADILPTGCGIPFISHILKTASNRLSWTENSSNWKTSMVPNQSQHILIGMLYLSKNGCFYVADKSCHVPIIFSRSCNTCRFSKNILCSYDDLKLAYLIAIQNFDVVFEKIKLKNENYCCYRYMKTSCCYLFYLGTYYKENDGYNYLTCFQENVHFSRNSKTDPVNEIIEKLEAAHISEHSKDFKQNKTVHVNEITGKLKAAHISKQEILIDSGVFSSLPLSNTNVVDNFTDMHILILNKLWTFIDQVFICNQILVLTLPQETNYTYSFSDKDISTDCSESRSFNSFSNSSFGNNSSNFYETDDDLDFAQLVDSLDSLFLEDKPRLLKLLFESTKQCSTLLPNHMYKISFSGNNAKEISSMHSHNKNSRPHLVKVKPSTRIIHSDECLGSNIADDYNSDIYCHINQIISERKVRENYIIRAVLVDKLYEEDNSSCSSQTEINDNITFCLLVKDLFTCDTIKVYLHYCPKNMFGLLPGLNLQMYGFVCICSKRGHLYLTSLSSFSIQIENSQNYYFADESITVQSDEKYTEDVEFLNLRSIPTSDYFKCLCYIIKIISAKLHLTCNNCMKDVEEKCLCLCDYSIKFNLSFIIDDGTNQLFAYCNDEIARKVLMLSESEWCRIITCVSETKQQLKFYHKMDEGDVTSSTVLNRIFCAYCSNKCLCRQVLLKCRKLRKLDKSKRDWPSIWCCDIMKISPVQLIPELIIKYKHMNSHNL